MKVSNEKKVVNANQDAGWDGIDEDKWEEYVATYATKEFGCSPIFTEDYEQEFQEFNDELNDLEHPYIYPTPLSADDMHRWTNRKLKKSVSDFVGRIIDENWHIFYTRIVKECKEAGFTNEVALAEAFAINRGLIGNEYTQIRTNASLKFDGIQNHIPDEIYWKLLEKVEYEVYQDDE